jgi:uncharacterized protein (TIGR03118 family)
MINTTFNSTNTASCSRLLLSAALTMAACLPAVAKADHPQSQYQQTNLVSDIADIAQVQDTGLVNAWGISFHETFPFWVSDNGRGQTTLYAVTNDASGAPQVSIVPGSAIGNPGDRAAFVTIPGNGSPTGQVANNSAGFNGDIFIFVSEDGTISGWRPGLGNAAEILATRPTAVYKGVTLATVGTDTVLLATNFREGTVDMYDSNSRLLGQFSDRQAPDGYAPFNIKNLKGVIFVTFAQQDADRTDDVPGRGHGLIDTFTPADGNFHRFATGKHVHEMNSPWGMTIAPPTFGTHANQLLVGNFGSGTIMTFDAHGRFRGLLENTKESPITIDGLWGLTFGADGGVSGVSTDLYFSAGPNDERHGLFGVIQALSESNDNDDHEGHGHHERD